MYLTIEQRRLLEGDEQRMARKESAMGWADASTAPDRFKMRILEVRTAVIEKRAIPAPSAEYRSAAAAAYRAPVRKVNTIPPSMLSMRDLRAKAARQAEEIHGAKYRAEVAAACLSNRVDEAYAAVRAGRNPFEEEDRGGFGGSISSGAGISQPGSDLSPNAPEPFRCAASSFSTSSRDDHRKASEEHCNFARSIVNRKGDRWAERADAHFSAQSAHAKAADQSDDNLFAECAGLAQVSCNRATNFKDLSK